MDKLFNISLVAVNGDVRVMFHIMISYCKYIIYNAYLYIYAHENYKY